jgi:hypothetical protein
LSSMSFGAKPKYREERPNAGEGACPACGTELDAGVTPRDSIVICTRCCATLFWDGMFSIATAEQLDCLPSRDRARLHAMLAAQHAFNESRKAN